MGVLLRIVVPHRLTIDGYCSNRFCNFCGSAARKLKVRHNATPPEHELYYVSSNHKVLLIEDDALIARTLSLSLPYKGFDVTVATTVSAAKQKLAEDRFAVVLLDLGLPDGSGLQFCRELRATGARVPILIITARTDEDSAVAGIEGGADDYVRKPFGLQELTARMRRLVDGSKLDRADNAFGNVRIDQQRHTVLVGSVELSLGKREFSILDLLVRANGDVVTRDRMLAAMERDQDIYDRTIDSHLSHLRKKLKEAAANIQIAAIYGVGYRLTLQ
jgi:DNA-binding response OmpR family regulator